MEVVERAMPASQLAWLSQPSTNRASAVQPRNGARKPNSPTTRTSRSLVFMACGSSSAPARNVSRTAPTEAMTRSHCWSAPSRSAPKAKAAMTPTQISTSASETRRWLASTAASTAIASQAAAKV